MKNNNNELQELFVQMSAQQVYDKYINQYRDWETDRKSVV